MNKPITKTTLKSFIGKNKENLLVNVTSSIFGSLYDVVEPVSGGFKPATITDKHHDNTLGIDEVWLVGNGSLNFYEAYQDQNLIGYKVSNCCGSFIVAVRGI